MSKEIILKKVPSFTIKYQKQVDVLISDVQISIALNPNETKDYSLFKQFKAIWDTGATNSVISPTVIEQLKLVPIGLMKVHTASGEFITEIYFVNFLLPNNVQIFNLKVIKGIIGPDFDVLIGMDIITIGDFAVTNKDRKTVLSFRIPSITCIDFVEEHPSGLMYPSGIKIGRNAPCPCGSGKKFKNCCIGKIK